MFSKNKKTIAILSGAFTGVLLMLFSEVFLQTIVSTFYLNDCISDITFLTWTRNMVYFAVAFKVSGACLLATALYLGYRNRQLFRKQALKRTLLICVPVCLLLLMASTVIEAPLVSANRINTMAQGWKIAISFSFYDYWIGQLSDDTYFAMRGSDGNVMTFVEPWQNPAPWGAYVSNYTALESLALADTTAGVIYLKDVPFNLALMSNIPANVRVICDYNGAQYQYVNSASSLGSPITVAVGQGVNSGYYTASDSGNRIIYASANASYVIQQSINSPTSGKVFIEKGTYQINTTIRLYNKNGITITGDGKNTILQCNIVSSFSSVFSILSYCSNITVENLKIMGGETQKTNYIYGILNAPYTVTTGVQIRNVEISGFGTGIRQDQTYTTSNVVIESCRLTDMRYSGIELRLIDSAVIQNNYVSDVGYYGIAVTGSNIVVTNNIIKDWAKLNSYSACVYAINPFANGTTSKNIVISNNIAEITTTPTQSTPVGFLVSGERESDSYIEDVVVSGNVISAPSNTNVSTALYAHARTSPTALMNVGRLTFSNNIVINWTGGITLYNVNYTTVDANVLYGVGKGIHSSNSIGSVISNNDLYGNMTSPFSYGIVAAGTYGADIRGNYIENFNCSITETYPSDTNGDYNIITYNTLKNIGSGGAIVLKTGTHTIVKGNYGFATENSVSSTNTTATTAVFNHGLAVTPTYVWCSFSSDAITGYTWTANATTVTVTVTGSSLPETWTVYAKMEYVP